MSTQDTGFEKVRIRQLQEERVHIQKKTFTKWMNSFLVKVNQEVQDMFTDLGDGKILMSLLEIISGESLGRPNRGRLRLQKIENVNKSLKFLSSKVRLESIGAEDIVDGNRTLILGLVWTIILRFQIQEITIEVSESSEKKSAKEALLLWCQIKTAGYPGVEINNFSTSWRNGLGFNALIHAHRPECIQYNMLSPHNHIGNLNNAFNTAFDQLGIVKLLDAEDVDVAKPDDKSIMTYVAAYYHYFAKMKSEVTGGKRITKIVGFVMEIEQMEQDYEALVTSLLDWIYATIRQLNNRNYPNVLEGIQREMAKFKDYMIKEKPPRYREKGNIEVHYFNICTKLKANGQKLYIPPEGKLLKDIEKSWESLEKAEHAHEKSLREEMMRQEKLEQLAAKFEKKASLRESWLTEMTNVLGDHKYGTDAAQVEAAVKKHEAISAEILARKDRFHTLTGLARELLQQDYHSKDDIRRKEQQISRKWTNLLEQLDKKKHTLMGFSELMGMFREIEGLQAEMKEVEGSVRSEDYGKHLLGTEDLLQKHSLLEVQIQNQGSRMDSLNKKAEKYSSSHNTESAVLQKRLQNTNSDFQSLQTLSSTRKTRLEEAKKFYQFIQDSEEEESWAVEKQRIAKSMVSGRDLMAVQSLLKKHGALEAEMVARSPKCDQVCQVGEELVRQKHYARKDLKLRVESLKDKWQKLQELTAARRVRLEDAEESHRYYQDANEAESWMREKMPLVCSDDYGKDETSAKKLLQRHVRLEEEIKSYQDDIQRLNELATLMTKAQTSNANFILNLEDDDDMDVNDLHLGIDLFQKEASPVKLEEVIQPKLKARPSTPEREQEWVEEIVDVPYEVEVDEVVEREVVKEVVQERRVAQVKARYKYKGEGMDCVRGEVLILLDKTNEEWWKVRKSNSVEGYVPANYVKEVDPKIVQKLVKKTVKEPQTMKVKKTMFKKELVRKPKKGSGLKRTPSVRSQANLHFDRENVELRQSGINATYRRLSKLVLARKRYLSDAIKLFRFYRECDEFESWIRDKEDVLQSKESLSQHVESLRRKFENLITDLVACSGVIDEINNLADEFVKTGHSQQEAVRKRQKVINDRWHDLNRLKLEREKTLEGASSIELFQRTSDETKSWIQEKLSVAATDDLGRDLKSVQDLQRKHQTLERELGPVEEKLSKVNLLATAVKTSYPNETGFVNKKQEEILSLWNGLQDRVSERRKRLNDAEQLEKFNNAVRDLMAWVNGVKMKSSDAQLPWDVPSAENLLKQHRELRDEINANKDRFEKMKVLGQKVFKKGVDNSVEIRKKLHKLEEEERKMLSSWDLRHKQLQDSHDLQIFNREADQIDLITSSHEAFLEFDDLGSTLESVETLLKRHENFDNTLQFQEERMNALNDMTEKLLTARQEDREKLASGKKSFKGAVSKLMGPRDYVSKFISQRRNEVIARRGRVKQKSAERKKLLQASLAYQHFLRETEELKSWLEEKSEWARDDSYKDLSNLQRKLQKQQAFEAELKANNDRLGVVNQIGEALIQEDHYASAEIEETLEELNLLWNELYSKASDKGAKLKQAHQQLTLNRTLEDAQNKLKDLEKIALSRDIGGDLRSVKKLNKDHQALENELRVHADTMQDVIQHGHSLAQAGHFDSESILKQVKDFDLRFENLKPSANQRKQQLDDSLRWHQFNFDVDGELQWIQEHMPSATSKDYGKTLVDAQNLFSKHQKLLKEIQGHQSMIQNVLATGKKYVSQKHFASNDIKTKSDELSKSWNLLLEEAEKRKKAMNLSLQSQQFLSEINEVESWIMEKLNIVSSQDCGRDAEAAGKLLTKHKALELDIGSYYGIVTDLQIKSEKLLKSKAPEAKLTAQRQESVQSQLNHLQSKAEQRKQRLEESQNLHEYMRETEDFEGWVTDQMQLACSEDYGTDYEHVQILEKKFEEFKRGVETGSERFHQCEKLSEALVNKGHTDSEDITARQEQLKSAWEKLLHQIEERDHNLVAAAEIHRFNHDVQEAMSRIQDKYSSMSDDLGRDLYGVQMLQRKHEAFENELVALEAQLQVLIDDSGRLQEQYPGENAEQIEQQQAVVVENWLVLQEKTSQRKEDLQASNDLQRFLASVRDLLSWSSEIQAEMDMEETVRDVAMVDTLKTRHVQLKAEMDAREDTFGSVAEAGQMMVDNSHFASEEISEKLASVLKCRENLHVLWQKRQLYLAELYDQQVFFRDANQLDTISASQEAYLGMPELSSSVDQVEEHLKKHEAFDKLLATQEDKLSSLQVFGNQLIDSHNFGAETVSSSLQAIAERRAYVKDVSADKRSKLEGALLYAKFNRDVSEAEAWIDEKLIIATEQTFTDIGGLQDKMKKLQKHQAFEAEIVANAERIKQIKKDGDQLLKCRHEQSSEIQHRVNKLLLQWNRLLEASADRGKGLEEAKDILEFNDSVDVVEAWIRDKEMMVLQGDTGRDYEHCLQLQKKMNDVGSDVQVDEAKLKRINSLADKLITQGRTDSKTVQDRKRNVNDKWRKLQGSFNNHKLKLSEALEIHAFNRDLNDISDRISEKVAIVSSEDYGKDLESVQSLQRKHEETERDMIALQNQMEKLEAQAKKLSKKYPDQKSAIYKKQHEVLDDWENLENLCDIRKQKLNSSLQYHKLEFDVRDLIQWSLEMCTRMTSSQLSNDVAGAEMMLEVHQERKAEIDGRSQTFQSHKDGAQRLIAKKHYASSDIREIISQLEKTEKMLHKTWEDRHKELSQCHDLRVFYEYAEQADGWIAMKEAFLANEDLGETLAGVEGLVRKHEGFEKTLDAQVEKIEALEGFASDLCSQGHYAAGEIKERLKVVLDRRDGLKEFTAERRVKLEESRKFQEFLRNIYELTGWINEKIQVSSDDSYKDLTNLKGKVQKHQAFEAEVVSNMKRVDNLRQEGQDLIADNHYRDKDILNLLNELDLCWQSLTTANDEKKERLQEAYQALQFTRSLEDLDAWMDDLEQQLESQDHGKDLTSVGILMKKHELMEQEIVNHKEKIQEVKQTCDSLKQAKHFMWKDLDTQCKATVERYKALDDPCKIRRENLEEALMMYQFFRDIEDELSWIREKLPLAKSKDVGNSLSVVQNLKKKHQALESEIFAREPLIESVTNTAQHMINAGHFSANDIQLHLNKLHKELRMLKEESERRKARLSDALESQTYYKEVSEAMSWIDDKMPALASTDYGKDEDSVQSHLKKLDALELDIDNFSNSVSELGGISRDLVTRQHFEYQTIEQTQVDLEAKYQHMRDAAVKRRQQLAEGKKLFEFLRETDAVIAWIETKEAIAGSEDYGRDVEHVEVLEQKFQDFIHDMYASEDRIVSVNSMVGKLCMQGHSEGEVIKERCNEINQLWVDIKDMAQARLEALAGAKQVHSFDRDVDETLDWIQEKEAVVSQEDYGHDVESVQALLRRHEGLERDLVAISEKVESITSEANELIILFPDAQEHIAAKHDQMVQGWNEVLDLTAAKKDKLEQAEQLQLYFDDYRELLAWCNEVLARITTDELARDVTGAEALISRHREHRAEIDTRLDAFQKFTETGQTLIDNQHFLSSEIDEKVTHLNDSLENLLKTWDQRRILYEQNLDVLQLKREMEQLETWLGVREAMLEAENFGESIDDVEGLIKKHEDFEKAVEAYEDKFNAIQRKTKLEAAFADQKANEADYKKEQRERDHAARLKLEQERILKERQLMDSKRQIESSDDDIGNIRAGGLQSKVDLVRQAITANHTPSFKEKTDSPKVSRRHLATRTSSFKSDDSGGSRTPKMKRTPSFTTRKRNHSFRDKYKMASQLPPVEMEAVLERKQELQSGGKKATIRSWKPFYTVLCGQLMCFFKDKQAFIDNTAASPPINLHNSKCQVAEDYDKKKNAFRLNVSDGAEFLFAASTNEEMSEWVKKIEFYAALPPSLQLMVFNPDKLDSPTASSNHSSRPNSPVNEDAITTPVSKLEQNADHEDITDTGSPQGLQPSPGIEERSSSVKELSSIFLAKSSSPTLKSPEKFGNARSIENPPKEGVVADKVIPESSSDVKADMRLSPISVSDRSPPIKTSQFANKVSPKLADRISPMLDGKISPTRASSLLNQHSLTDDDDEKKSSKSPDQSLKLEGKASLVPPIEFHRRNDDDDDVFESSEKPLPPKVVSPSVIRKVVDKKPFSSPILRRKAEVPRTDAFNIDGAHNQSPILQRCTSPRPNIHSGTNDLNKCDGSEELLTKRNQLTTSETPMLAEKLEYSERTPGHLSPFSAGDSSKQTGKVENAEISPRNPSPLNARDRLSPAVSISSGGSTPPLPGMAPPSPVRDVDSSFGNDSYDGTESAGSSPQKSNPTTPEPKTFESSMMPRFSRPFGSNIGLGMQSGFGGYGQSGGRPLFGSNIVSKNLQRETALGDQKLNLYGDSDEKEVESANKDMATFEPKRDWPYASSADRLNIRSNEESSNKPMYEEVTEKKIEIVSKSDEESDEDEDIMDNNPTEAGDDTITSPRRSAVSIKDRIKQFATSESTQPAKPNVQPGLVQKQARGSQKKFVPSPLTPESVEHSEEKQTKPSNVSSRWQHGEETKAKAPTKVVINRFTGEPMYQATSPRSRTSSASEDRSPSKLNDSDDFNDQIVSAMYGEIVFGQQGNQRQPTGGYGVSSDELDTSTEEEDDEGFNGFLPSMMSHGAAHDDEDDDDWPDLPDDALDKKTVAIPEPAGEEDNLANLPQSSMPAKPPRKTKKQAPVPPSVCPPPPSSGFQISGTGDTRYQPPPPVEFQTLEDEYPMTQPKPKKIRVPPQPTRPAPVLPLPTELPAPSGGDGFSDAVQVVVMENKKEKKKGLFGLFKKKKTKDKM